MVVYTSEELLTLITRAESYFQRLSNEDLGRSLKGTKPKNVSTIECVWLLKEALSYCNELELYGNMQTHKIVKSLSELLSGHDVDIIINTGDISSPALDFYVIGDNTPIATNVLHGKVQLSYPTNTIGTATAISDSDPRIPNWDLAYDTVTYIQTLLASVLITDYDSNITGVKNSVNKVFTTTQNFISGTTKVYLNGIRLTNNINNDYTETGTNQITFIQAPDAGDLMIIEYIKQ